MSCRHRRKSTSRLRLSAFISGARPEENRPPQRAPSEGESGGVITDCAAVGSKERKG
jgi:hypothetical protein